jgi:hypothetical protein
LGFSVNKVRRISEIRAREDVGGAAGARGGKRNRILISLPFPVGRLRINAEGVGTVRIKE